MGLFKKIGEFLDNNPYEQLPSITYVSPYPPHEKGLLDDPARLHHTSARLQERTRLEGALTPDQWEAVIATAEERQIAMLGLHAALGSSDPHSLVR